MYRVEPIGSVRPGLVDDLIRERARVLQSLGPASTFRGNSGVKMASSYYERRTEIMREPGLRRVKLAERALGAQVAFKQRGNQKQRRGRVVFADYDTLNLLIDTGEACQQLVSLKIAGCSHFGIHLCRCCMGHGSTPLSTVRAGTASASPTPGWPTPGLIAR